MCSPIGGVTIFNIETINRNCQGEQIPLSENGWLSKLKIEQRKKLGYKGFKYESNSSSAVDRIVTDIDSLTLEKSDQLRGEQTLNFCLGKAYYPPSHHQAAFNRKRPLYANKLPDPKRKIPEIASSAKAYIVLIIIALFLLMPFPKSACAPLLFGGQKTFGKKLPVDTSSTFLVQLHNWPKSSANVI